MAVSLRKIFGKVAAVTALAATLVFYGLGFHIGHAYYQQWQENKAEVTATWDGHSQDHTANLPWLAAGGAAGIAYAAGFTGIALAKKRRDHSSSGYYGGSGYRSRDDGFFWGYMMGSSGRSSGSSSSSSSKDNGGAAAAIVIIGAAAIAAGASVVSYKAVKANFFGPPDPEETPLRVESRMSHRTIAPYPDPAPKAAKALAPEENPNPFVKPKKGFSL